MALVTILVSSFDGFSDCWRPFCHGIKKYWPDCPYPIFLITNNKDFEDERVTALSVGKDRGWSQNLLSALDEIDTPYVMYFQEDYWISHEVNTSVIKDYVAAMEKWGINYLRLLAFPQPDGDFPADSRLGVIATEAAYRTSVQISLWRKTILQELVDPTEKTAWEFEIRGTERSRKHQDTFLSIKQRANDPYYYGVRYVCTAINRGRWSRYAKAYAKHEGIEVDFSNLPSETWWYEFRRNSRAGALAGLLVYRLNLVLRHPVIAFQKIRVRMGGGKELTLSKDQASDRLL